jgi:hypothetical protein
MAWNPSTRVTDKVVYIDDLEISFHRTVRMPDNHKTSKLPPGLGRFPLYNADEYTRTLPREMAKKGGVLIPMHSKSIVRYSLSLAKLYLFY